MATVLPPFNPIAGVPEAIAAAMGRHRQKQQRQTQAGELAQLAQMIQGGRQIDPSQFSSPQVAQLALGQIIQQQGQGGDPFTLGQGQTRFGPGGQPIANVPAAPPSPLLPSQQISQQKLNRINQLQDKVQAGTISEKEAGLLDKMLAGVSPVQISFGKSTAAERTAIAETQASLDSLGNLENLFDKSTTVTGPIAGRIEPTKGLFGLTTTEQESLMAATSSFKNAVIKDITGAQMSEPEAKRIMKEIPDITDPPERWKAKAAQTRRNLQAIQKRRSEVLKRSGIVSPLDGQTGIIDVGSMTLEQVQAELRELEQEQ